jgi:hypothetical protein
VAELRVPATVDDSFREHYRSLILGSLLHSAEVERERHRERGHRLRARRAERVVDRLRPPQRQAPPAPAPLPTPTPAPTPAPPVVVAPVVTAPVVMAPALRSADDDRWFGPGIRRAAFAVWLLTLVALLADLIVLGVGSYATIGADLGLVAMTFVVFFAHIDDLTGPRR